MVGMSSKECNRALSMASDLKPFISPALKYHSYCQRKWKTDMKIRFKMAKVGIGAVALKEFLPPFFSSFFILWNIFQFAFKFIILSTKCEILNRIKNLFQYRPLKAWIDHQIDGHLNKNGIFLHIRVACTRSYLKSE